MISDLLDLTVLSATAFAIVWLTRQLRSSDENATTQAVFCWLWLSIVYLDLCSTFLGWTGEMGAVAGIAALVLKTGNFARNPARI